LKVLHFSALDGRTGAGVAAARIHAGLLARGVQSRFCVAHPGAGLDEAFTPAVSLASRAVRAVDSRLDIARLRGQPGSDDYVLSTGLSGFDMARIVRAEEPDIVQLHWIAGNAFRLYSLRGIRQPIVWRLSDMWPFCGIQHLEPDAERYTTAPSASADLSEAVRRRKRAIYGALPNLTLVCPSRWLAGEVQRSALLGERPVKLIPTSCVTETFHPRDQGACRLALGLPIEDDFVLVGATSMGTRWKGLDLFVEAVAKIAPGRPRPLHVVAFGRDALKAEALAGVVKLTNVGPVADRELMAILYSAADVFVAPSRMENLANTVLESLACGTPVAAFAIGGMPDMIDHRLNGWLADAYDTDQLSEGIAWLLDAPGKAERSAAARAKVLSRFSLEAEIGGYIELYESLLVHRRGGRASA
jgi:glycosyltransferase involved in cell wall biosynthesis